MTSSRFHNRTRESESIPRALLRRGKFYLLPVYVLASMSDLGREGMQNSGSYRFAEHVYGNKAGGRFGVGWLVDRIFLSTRKARSFRNRVRYTRREIVRLAPSFADTEAEVHIAAVPSGLGRELFDAAEILRDRSPETFARVTFHMIDLDPEVLHLAGNLATERGIAGAIRLVHGDALDATCYPAPLHIVVSTGLCEFLPDDLLRAFYGTVFMALAPGGYFVTTATAPNRLADFLLENLGEIHAFYRREPALAQLLASVPFSEVTFSTDSLGLQTLVTARK